MQEKKNEYHKWLEIECRVNKMGISIRETGGIMKLLTMKHTSIAYCVEPKELFILDDARKNSTKERKKDILKLLWL